MLLLLGCQLSQSTLKISDTPIEQYRQGHAYGGKSGLKFSYILLYDKYWIFRAFWERFRVPVTLIYGGFPVQLTTYIGAPICRIDEESYLQLQERVRVEIKNMISLNQRNKSVIEAVTERFPSFL